MNDRAAIDLSGQPHWRDADRTIMPTVEEGLLGVRTAAVGWIGRLRAGVETYAPVPDVDQGGLLELGQAQARHLHAELGKLIEKWDTEPRDLADEADIILRDAGHLGRNRASTGYEIETDGTAVYVYHHDGHQRTRGMSHIGQYAYVLERAGYTGPEGSQAPTVQSANDDHAARLVAIPPAAESF